MRHPQPFFRDSKSVWYVQVGKRQHGLGKDKKAASRCGADLVDCFGTETKCNSTTGHDAIDLVIRAFNWAIERRGLPSDPVAVVANKPRSNRRDVVISPRRLRENPGLGSGSGVRRSS